MELRPQRFFGFRCSLSPHVNTDDCQQQADSINDARADMNSPRQIEDSSDDEPLAYLSRLENFREQVVPLLAGHWLRHSLALSHLESIAIAVQPEDEKFGCGPVAFGALVGISSEELIEFFPESEHRLWTNRRDMEKALRTFGLQFRRCKKHWPKFGLCFVHWSGPWTNGYPVEMLRRTHWVAVVEDYVFDVNWGGWLPKQNWEEIIVEELLSYHAFAEGWEPLTAYEIGL
jgi:hypothetical protein